MSCTVQLGKSRKLKESIPTVETDAYADGDLICNKVALSNILNDQHGTGKITDIIVADVGVVKKGLRVILFDNEDDLSAAVNAAYALDTDTTASNYLGEGQVVTADYEDHGSGHAIAHCNKNDFWSDIVIEPEATTDYTIYYVLVANEAVTYLGTTDIELTFCVERD